MLIFILFSQFIMVSQMKKNLKLFQILLFATMMLFSLLTLIVLTSMRIQLLVTLLLSLLIQSLVNSKIVLLMEPSASVLLDFILNWKLP